MQLMTVVDHGPTLAGQRVHLPPVRVRRVLGPTLVVIEDLGGRHNYYRSHRWDRLVVLLPPGAAVSRNEPIVVVGTIRTVHGAQLSGDLSSVREDVLEDSHNATLLVAESVRTPDGINLAGR